MHFLNFLVSITCFFLLLFSIHLFFSKKGNRTNNILLSVLFFARVCQILTSLIITAGQEKVLAIFFQSFTPLYFAAPACLYLYITGFISDRKALKTTEWLHFIPALVAIIHVIPWPGMEPLDWKLIASELGENGYLSLEAKSGFFPGYFHNWGRTILILTYLALCWRAVLKSKIKMQNGAENPGKDWIFFLISVSTLFQLIGLVPIVFKTLDIPIYHTFIIVNCMVLLAILSYALHKPHIFYGYLLVSIDWKNAPSAGQVIIDDEVLSFQKTDYKKINVSTQKKNILSAEQLSSYGDLIKQVMENEQLFLKVDLQIIDLATKINIPVHHCSFVLNNEIGKNFRDWINGYRVEHFLKQYPLVANKLTIEAIAQESGFKSLATFYNAFKKEKGVLPKSFFTKTDL